MSLPLIVWGLHFTTHDGAWHLLWYENFSSQLAAGDAYPRWAADMNAGFGSPIFFYYPPLVYYITSAFSWIPVSGWHHLGFTMALGISASGLSAYYWLRDSFEARIALVAALLYIVLPYHIANVYLRGALAESTAFVWMPLVLMFTQRMARGSRRAFFGTAAAYGLLMATHLLTAMIFAPVALGYALVAGREGGRIRALLIATAALLLAAAMAAAYVVPAITMQDLVHFEEMTLGTLSYKHWFVGRGYRVQGTPRYFWFVVLPGTLLLSSALFIWSKRRLQAASGYWALVCAASIFMTLWISEPVWELVRVLQTLQFPWRFHVVLCTAILPVVAASLAALARPFGWRERIFLLVLLLLSVTFIADLVTRVDRQYAQREPSRERVLELRSDFRSFFPKTVPLEPRLNLGQLEANIEDLFAKMGWEGESGPFARITSGTATVRVVQNDARLIRAVVSASDASEVEFARFYFVGLQARTAAGDELRVVPSELGMIKVDVPPGEHTVELVLGETAPETVGEILSVAAISLSTVAFILLLFRSRRERA